MGVHCTMFYQTFWWYLSEGLFLEYSEKWHTQFQYNYKGAFTLTLSEHPCPSLCPSPWRSFCLHYIRGSDPRSSEAILVACSSDHRNRRLWACALQNLRQTRTSASEEIATCSDELRHGHPRQKSQDTNSDQCKHETSIHLFWLHPSSDSNALTEITDVV